MTQEFKPFSTHQILRARSASRTVYLDVVNMEVGSKHFRSNAPYTETIFRTPQPDRTQLEIAHC